MFVIFNSSIARNKVFALFVGYVAFAAASSVHLIQSDKFGDRHAALE